MSDDLRFFFYPSCDGRGRRRDGGVGATTMRSLYIISYTILLYTPTGTTYVLTCGRPTYTILKMEHWQPDLSPDYWHGGREERRYSIEIEKLL